MFRLQNYRRMMSGTRLAASVLAASVFAVNGCWARTRTTRTVPPVANTTPPAFLLGDFEDDYGARFTITPSDFFQRSRNHYRIVRWDVGQQFFIAQNDSLNTSDAGQWTRIDWLRLDNMAPYTWAFCFTAYKAATRAEAEQTASANRDAPLTGCNRFPFSRMKPGN